MMNRDKFRLVIANFSRISDDIRKQKLQWTGMPVLLEISSNALCNLSCIMCRPAGHGQDYARARLDDTLIRKTIESLGPSLFAVTPSSGSEPFLGSIDCITGACKTHGAGLAVTTNGVLLTPERFRLIENELLALQVSFDSHVPEIYESIRAGAKYDTVLQNLQAVIPRAGRLGTQTCASSVLLKNNIVFLPEYIDFVADIGFQSVELQRLYHRYDFSSIDAFGNIPDDRIEELIGHAVTRAEQRGIDLVLNREKRTYYLFGKRTGFGLTRSEWDTSACLYYLTKRHPSFCYQAAHFISVAPDGAVYPCCLKHVTLKMGNIHEKPLTGIWNGPEYRNLRESFYTGNLRQECRGCPILSGFSAIELRPGTFRWSMRKILGLVSTHLALRNAR